MQKDFLLYVHLLDTQLQCWCAQKHSVLVYMLLLYEGKVPGDIIVYHGKFMIKQKRVFT